MSILVLKEVKCLFKVLAELLLEKEVIFKDDLLKIFGKRPFDEIDETTEKIETNKKLVKEKENTASEENSVEE